MVREITDMTNIPSPSMNSRTGENTHTLLTERLSDKSFHSFEAKLSEIIRQKKQLQNENIELAAQIAELTKRLDTPMVGIVCVYLMSCDLLYR